MTRQKRDLVVGILFLAVALTVVLALVRMMSVSGPYEDGLDAYDSGDHGTALQLSRLATEQDDAATQYTLGIMYHDGLGVPRDYTQAVKWFQLAAEQGHAGAQYNLGVMYLKGDGVPQAYVQALVWGMRALTAFIFGVLGVGA